MVAWKANIHEDYNLTVLLIDLLLKYIILMLVTAKKQWKKASVNDQNT